VSAVRRPDAPDELNDEQAAEWFAVVDRLPADWFRREHWPLLTAYCRHVVTHRRLEELIRREEASKRSFQLDKYDRLLKMRERESRAICCLATKMRLTQSSQFDRTKVPRRTGSPRPWQT